MSEASGEELTFRKISAADDYTAAVMSDG